MNVQIRFLQSMVLVIVMAISLSSTAQVLLPQTRGQYNDTIPSTMDSFGVPEMANRTDPVLTQTIDLGKTIRRYAELKQISLEDARLKTLLFLGMSPRIKTVHAAHENPTFENIGEDRYQVTALKSFFDALPAMQLCLELGKKQVFISCRMISIDPKQSKRLNAFITPGSAEVYCAKMPDVTPIATVKTDFADDPNIKTFVSSSTVVRKNTPVTTGSLSQENLEKLKTYLKTTNTEANFAPNIIAFPSQLATISDASQRPFVVGLEAVHGEFKRIGMQPVIQAIEDGITIRLRAIPRDGQVQLFSDIALSEVGEVHTLTFASSGEDNQQAIQVPEHNLRQIHLSTLLDADTAILIDPNFIQKENSHSKKTSNRKKTIFIFQAKMIDMN